MSLRPLSAERDLLDRAILAVNDARNLAEALGANLGWLAEALAPTPLSEESHLLAKEAVAVCVELTRLLGGALGSTQRAQRSRGHLMEHPRLLDMLLAAQKRVEAFTDRSGTILLEDGPPDLVVPVDAELLAPVLDGLLLHALHASPDGETVTVSYTRSGISAVLAITEQGPALTDRELRHLHAMVDLDAENEGPVSEFDSAVGAWRALLAEEGCYLDAENRAEGGTTLYVIFPTDLSRMTDGTQLGTPIAISTSPPSGARPEALDPQEHSATMPVNSERFGTIEVDKTDCLSFPSGLIGFADEREFILIRRKNSEMIGWLQSTATPHLALPVVSAHVLAPKYPDVPIEEVAEKVGLGSEIEELAVLVVMSAPPGQPATVNLMAPIIVNATTRMGRQVLLEGTQFGTRELFVIPRGPQQVPEDPTAGSAPPGTQHSPIAE